MSALSQSNTQKGQLRNLNKGRVTASIASGDMRKLFLIVATILAFWTANPSQAGVYVSIGIPGPVYYGPSYYYGPGYYYGPDYYYPSGYYWGPSGYIYYYRPHWRHRYWRYHHWCYY
jgi:hypothetical protein